MPYFAANISEGLLFNPKPQHSRIESSSEAGFEAIEISQPYNVSAVALASLLGDDTTPERLEMACIDSYAPTTVEGKHSKPRGYMGWAGVPGETRMFHDSFDRTLYYASELKCKTVNQLLGLPYHSYNMIQESLEILQVYKGTETTPDAVRVRFRYPIRDITTVTGKVVEVTLPISNMLMDTNTEHEVSTYNLSETMMKLDTGSLTLMRKLLPSHILNTLNINHIFTPVYIPEIADIVKQQLSECVPLNSYDVPSADSEDSPLNTPQMHVKDEIDLLDVPKVNQFMKHNHPHLFVKPLHASLQHSCSDQLLRSLAFTVAIEHIKYGAMLLKEKLGDEAYLCLEPVSDIPGYFLTNQPELLRLIVYIGADNVGILFDTYHIGRIHGSVAETLTKAQPLVRHIQQSSLTREEPHIGELSGEYLMNMIDKLRYHGWVGLEYRPSAGKSSKQSFDGWLGEHQCRRHGSAGILFTCIGKQGKPYCLLAQDHKKGNPWGPFWGRPDKEDPDVEYTAVRETVEESQGVIADTAVLYTALKNENYHYKIGTFNLFIVHLGTLGTRDRDNIIAQYSEKREFVMKKYEAEVLAIRWFDISELHKQLTRTGKVTETVKLRGFFRRELSRAMDHDELMIQFCTKNIMPIQPLMELIDKTNGNNNNSNSNSNTVADSKKWYSAPV